MVSSGKVTGAAAINVEAVAVNTLAAYSADHASALGMSQQAALDIVEQKLDTAAHALTQGTAIKALESSLESTAAGGHGGDLAAAAMITTAVGGAAALAAGLSAGGSKPLQAGSTTAFGEQATAADIAHAIQAGTISVATGMAQVEGFAAAAHASMDLGLSALDSALGSNAAHTIVETEMGARIASGAAAADLVGAINAGTMTVAAAIAEMQTEAAQSHGSQFNALASLYSVAPASAAPSVVAAMKTIEGPNYTSLGADVTAAVGAKMMTADQAVTLLSNMALNDSIAQYAAGASIAALVNSGQITTANAIADMRAVLTGDQAVFTMLGMANAGSLAIQTEIATSLPSLVSSSFTTAQVMNDFTTAVKSGTITGDPAITMLALLASASSSLALPARSEIFTLIANNSVGAMKAMADIGNALSGSQASFLISQMAINSVSGTPAVQVAAGAEFAAMVAANKITATYAASYLNGQDANSATIGYMIGLAASPGGNSIAGDPIATIARRVTNWYPPVSLTTVIADIDAAVKGRAITGDQAVSVLTQLVGKTTTTTPAVASTEIAALITAGALTPDAAVADIKTSLTARTVTGDQTLALFSTLVTSGNLATQPKAVAGIASLVVGGSVAVSSGLDALGNAVVAAVKSGGLPIAQAITTLETTAQAVHQPIDGKLLALDQALGGNAAVETEIKARITNGAAVADLIAALNGGTATVATVLSTLQAECAISGGSLAASNGMDAFSNALAIAVKSGAVQAAQAITTLEAMAQTVHQSIDARLVALDQAIGGNAAIETEISTRIGNGAALADLTAALNAGTATVASLVSTVQAACAIAHVSPGGPVGTLCATLNGRPDVLAAMSALVTTPTDVTAAIQGLKSGGNKTASTDQALVALEQALGGNAAIETQISSRLASGAAAAELANVLNAAVVTMTPSTAISILQAEAAAAHVSPVGPIARLCGVLATTSRPEITAALAGLLKTADDVTAAINGMQAAGNKWLSIDSTLSALDQAAGGSAVVEAAMQSRLASGATFADLNAMIKAGTSDAYKAISLIESLARQFHVSVDATLVAFDKVLGGNTIVETELASRLNTLTAVQDLVGAIKSGATDPASAAASIVQDAATAHISPVPMLASLGVLYYSDRAVMSTVAGAIKTAADATAAIAALETVAGGTLGQRVSSDAVLWALDRALGGNATVEAELATRFNGGTTQRELLDLIRSGILAPDKAITVVEGLAPLAKASSDAMLINIYASTNNAAIHDELVGRLTNGAAAEELAGLTKAGSKTVTYGVTILEREAAAVGLAPVVPLAQLFLKLGGDTYVFNELTAKLKLSPETGAAAVAAIEAYAPLEHQSIDATLIALDKAAGNNPAIEAELIARFNNGAMQNAVIADIKAGVLTPTQAISVIYAETALAHASPDATLLALDGKLGGNAMLEQEITARLNNGAAATDLATRVNSGTLDVASALGIIQSGIAISHSPAMPLGTFAVLVNNDQNVIGALASAVQGGTDIKAIITAIEAASTGKNVPAETTLLALDTTLHGNAAVEAEIAARIANGATTAAVNQAMTAGTIGASQGVALIENLAHLAHVSADNLLLNLDKSWGANGNAAVESELSARLTNGTVAGELAALIGTTGAAHITASQAISIIEGAATAAKTTPDVALIALYKSVGNDPALMTELSARIAGESGSLAAGSIGQAMYAGRITGQQAVDTIEAMARATGASIDHVLLGLAQYNNPAVSAELAARNLSGLAQFAQLFHPASAPDTAARLINGSEEAALAAAVKSGTITSADAIKYLQLDASTAASANSTVTQTAVLARLYAGLGGDPAVGAALVTAVHGDVTTAIRNIEALGHPFVPSLAALNRALGGGNVAVLSELPIQIANEASSGINPSDVQSQRNAIAAVENVAQQYHVSVDAALVALHNLPLAYGVTRAPLQPLVELELAKRLGDGSAAADLATACRSGGSTPSLAAATILAAAGLTANLNDPNQAAQNYNWGLVSSATASAVINHQVPAVSPIAALAGLAIGVDGDPAAVSALAGAIKSAADTSSAIATIEAIAAANHAPIDATLVALDKAMGGNAVVEAELVVRIDNGAAVADLASRIKGGVIDMTRASTIVDAMVQQTHGSAADAMLLKQCASIGTGSLTGAAAVSALEAFATKNHLSIDLGLNQLGALDLNNAAVQTEQANRVQNYQAMVGVFDAVQSGQMTRSRALGILAAESGHSTLSANESATRYSDIEVLTRLSTNSGDRVESYATTALNWIRSGFTYQAAPDWSGDRVIFGQFVQDVPFMVVAQPDNVGKMTIDDAVSLYSVMGNLIHQPAIEVARHVSEAAQGLGASADYALLQVADRTHNDPGVLTIMASRLIRPGIPDGSTVDELTAQVAAGTMTPDAANKIFNDALSRVQLGGDALAKTNTPLLPGEAQGEVLLARLQNSADASLTKASSDLAAWQKDHPGAHNTALESQIANLQGFESYLGSHYSIAIGAGETLIPYVDELGQALTAQAIDIGMHLITPDVIQNPDAQAALIQKLIDATHSTTSNLPHDANGIVVGASVDAALTMASFGAAGQSTVLNTVMTGRLLSGVAVADITDMICKGALTTEQGLAILTGEVSTLAGSNPQGAAIGLDLNTAQDFVIGKLELAAIAVNTGAMVELGTGYSSDNPYQYSIEIARLKSAEMRTALETNHADSVINGLGVTLGLLQQSPDSPDVQQQLTVTQNTLNILLNQRVQTNLLAAAAASDDGQLSNDRVDAITKDSIAGFESGFQKGAYLGGAINAWTNLGTSDSTSTSSSTEAGTGTQSKGDIPYQSSWSTKGLSALDASVGSYHFIGTSTTQQTSQLLSSSWGNGVSGYSESSAGVTARAGISAIGLSAAGTAGAMQKFGIDFGQNVHLEAFAEAMASGAVKAGLTGITLQGYIGMTQGIALTQSHTFDMGGGVSMLEDVKFEARATEAVYGNVDVGFSSNRIAIAARLGTRIGEYVSAGYNIKVGNDDYSGSYGGTVYSPGVVGLDVTPKVAIKDGKLSVGLDLFVGAEIGGFELKLDFTVDLHTLSPVGNILRDGFVTIAKGMQNAFGDAEHAIGDFFSGSFASAFGI